MSEEIFQGMNDVRLRPARADAADERFLRLMLVEAYSWRPGGPRVCIADTATRPDLARYINAWGREGDKGVIAEAGGRTAGAAWWRSFSENDHGYGFIDPTVPEVSLAVVPRLRGHGVGTALLRALIAEARHDNVPALSLSVEVDNPALRLYERLGFSRVGTVGNAWTMRLDTPSG